VPRKSVVGGKSANVISSNKFATESKSCEKGICTTGIQENAITHTVAFSSVEISDANVRWATINLLGSTSVALIDKETSSTIST